MPESYFNNTISKDLFGLCIGKQLGHGVHRKVFEWLPNPSYVAKFEIDQKSFANIIEWETWKAVKDVAGVHKWFAPCLDISPCGSILLMRRAQPVLKRELPERLPAFLTDTKRTNFGRIDKQVVCIDYGTHLMLENGMTKRMVKAEWFDL